MLPGSAIGTEACDRCHLCGAQGAVLYAGLADLLFGAPGLWTLRRCANPHCGLLWLDPRPTPAEIGKAYATYYTHADIAPSEASLPRQYVAARYAYLRRRYGYGPPRPVDPLGPLARLKALRPDWRAAFAFEVLYLPALPGGRLLDVGAGWGDFMRRMAGFGWQVEGVDFDPQAVANARSKGLTVHHGQLAELAYPDASFDAVTMSHLIEHVHNPLELVAESRRILRPGGRLVVVTPNSLSMGHRLFRRHWRGLEPPRHLHLFNRRALALLAARAGFTRVRVVATIRDASSILLASRALRRSGAHRMGQPEGPLVRRWAVALQLLEWLWLRVNPEVGEELVLVAER